MRFVAPSLLVAASLVLGCHSNHKDMDDDHAKSGSTEERITLSQVPAAVKAGFDKQYPGAKIEHIEKETYADGTVHYEFEFEDKSGKDMEVEFNAMGEVLEDH